MFKSFLSPVFITLYPSLFLYSRSYQQAEFSSFMQSLLLGFSVLFIVLLASYFFTRSWSASVSNIGASFDNKSDVESIILKRSLLITLAMFLFLIYGHIFSIIYQFFFNGFVALGQDNIPITFFNIVINLLLLGISFFLLYRFLCLIKGMSNSTVKKANALVFLFLSFLLVSPIFIIGKNITKEKLAVNELLVNQSEIKKIGLSAFDDSYQKDCQYCDSDVYLIVLDGYARNDILKEFYGYDNSDFLNELKDQGFQVFDEAISNYSITYISLASILNFDYIDSFFETDQQYEKTHLHTLIRDSLLSQQLKQRGYKFIQLSSTYGPTMINENADELYTCRFGWLKDDFIRVYVEGTFLRIFNASAVNNLAECHLQNFQWLSNVAANDPVKKFVLAHVVMPHHPYLFNSKGDILREANLSDQFQYQKLLWADRDAYIEQLKFLNSTVASIVKEIKKDSKKPPFIIIMSDHGPHLIDKKGKKNENYSRGRAGILLSIHTPSQNKSLEIASSVNIFRALFNTYFNDDFEILPDIYHHSLYSDPFSFDTNALD